MGTELERTVDLHEPSAGESALAGAPTAERPLQELRGTTGEAGRCGGCPSGGGCSKSESKDVAALTVNVEPRAAFPEAGCARLTTGDLARVCDTTVRTVRFYEEAGLIEPKARVDGGHRLFEQDQLLRLQLIMDLREAGLSLQEIKELFALKENCSQADEASSKLAAALEARVEEMQRKIAVLRRLREELVAVVAVVRECRDCTDVFPKDCNGCDVMSRPDLPRAMRLLWGSPPDASGETPETRTPK